MNSDTVYSLFDPDSVGWLRRRVSKGDAITAADLARIAHANREVFSDDVFQQQVLLALEQQLPARRGRPPEDPMVVFMTDMAAVLIEDRAAEIRAERKASGASGELEPRIQAAEEAVRFLRMNMSAASLLNRISKQKNA